MLIYWSHTYPFESWCPEKDSLWSWKETISIQNYDFFAQNHICESWFVICYVNSGMRALRVNVIRNRAISSLADWGEKNSQRTDVEANRLHTTFLLQRMIETDLPDDSKVAEVSAERVAQLTWRATDKTLSAMTFSSELLLGLRTSLFLLFHTFFQRNFGSKCRESLVFDRLPVVNWLQNRLVREDTWSIAVPLPMH